MIEVEALWTTRAKQYWGMALRYLRLIGNSGFLFALYLLIIIGSYYYSVLLDWLPEAFPTKAFFVIVSAVVLTRGAVRTFVKEGDIVFLLPVEEKMKTYFRYSLLYSFLLQSVSLAIVFVLLAPLFHDRLAADVLPFAAILFFLIAGKYWNVVCMWEEQRLRTDEERRMHLLFRFFINGVLTFFLFSPNSLPFILFTFFVMVLLYVLYYRPFAYKYSIKWEHLFEVEERMLSFFYRIVHLFTDVPKLKAKVKKRTLLKFLLSFVRYEQKSTFHYLYLRSFLRANDYFGMYIRLGIIAAIFIAIVPEGILRYVVLLLFLYLSGFQLATLSNHYQTKLWVDLYPIELKQRRKSFSAILLALLLAVTVFLAIMLFILEGASLHVAAIIVIGAIFSYIFSYKLVYIKRDFHQ